MLAALGRAGLDLMRQRANEMTAGKRKTDQAGGCTPPPQTEAVLVAPHILIAENQPAISESALLDASAGRVSSYRLCRQANPPYLGGQAYDRWRRPGGAAPGSESPRRERGRRLLASPARPLAGCPWVLPQIIVLTTNPQVHTVLGPRERVLQKPFHVPELLALIRQMTPAAS